MFDLTLVSPCTILALMFVGVQLQSLREMKSNYGSAGSLWDKSRNLLEEFFFFPAETKEKVAIPQEEEKGDKGGWGSRWIALQTARQTWLPSWQTPFLLLSSSPQSNPARTRTRGRSGRRRRRGSKSERGRRRRRSTRRWTRSRGRTGKSSRRLKVGGTFLSFFLPTYLPFILPSFLPSNLSFHTCPTEKTVVNRCIMQQLAQGDTFCVWCIFSLKNTTPWIIPLSPPPPPPPGISLTFASGCSSHGGRHSHGRKLGW